MNVIPGFVTQGEMKLNCCGAMTLAYWRWLTTGQTPEKKAALTEIQEIYDDVQFKAAFPSLYDYCDPAKLMRILTDEHHKNPVFYVGDDMIKGMRDALMEKNPGYAKGYRVVDRPLALDQIQPGQYMMMICSMNGVAGALHYVLAYRKDAENLRYINPWNGSFSRDYKTDGGGLTYLNSGILIL